MERSKIREIMLANGFQLKEQEGREPDLHEYVYQAAEALVAAEQLNWYRPEGFGPKDTIFLGTGTMCAEAYRRGIEAGKDQSYEGFAGQGRRLFELCVEHGANPGHVKQWLETKLAETGSPKFHGPLILEYPADVFVVFDGTDDGSSLLGARRSLEEAKRLDAWHTRIENEGPNADDPMGFENAAALKKVLEQIWWNGFNNGKGQATAGHSAGYEHADCASAVDGYIVSRLGKRSHD